MGSMRGQKGVKLRSAQNQPGVKLHHPTLEEGPSTVFCVAVVACTVVIRPGSRAKLTSMSVTPDFDFRTWYPT